MAAPIGPGGPMDTARTRSIAAPHGFTLLELLTVVVVLGILATIAIPAYLEQRQQAFGAAVLSDVRTAAVAVETDASAGHYPVELRLGADAGPLDEPQALSATDVRLSDGVGLSYVVAVDRRRF